jgi:MFS family permease
LPLCGFSALTMLTAANSFVQLASDPHMRGRVMALYMAVFMGGTPVGAPTLGWVAEQFGARWTLVGGGALTVIGTLAAAITFGHRQRVVVTPHLRPRPHLDVSLREVAFVTETVAA